jgi:hypothetical protein
MPEKSWITDRPPTEADADGDGDVLICTTPRLNLEDWEYEKWNDVTPGWPWRHTYNWTPPTPEPEPTPAAPGIPEPLRMGAESFYLVVVSNDNPGNDGQSITWPRCINGQTTLQAALRRQKNIGDFFGTTYIAECRIIPILTREAPANG